MVHGSAHPDKRGFSGYTESETDKALKGLPFQGGPLALASAAGGETAPDGAEAGRNGLSGPD